MVRWTISRAERAEHERRARQQPRTNFTRPLAQARGVRRFRRSTGPAHMLRMPRLTSRPKRTAPLADADELVGLQTQTPLRMAQAIARGGLGIGKAVRIVHR